MYNTTILWETLRHLSVLGFIAALLNFPANWNIIAYILLLIFIITPIIPAIKQIFKTPLFYLLIFIAAVSYLFLSPAISNIELWGDEIGVIEIAEGPFPKIVELVSSRHAAVPPLDYWSLHLWIKTTPFLAALTTPEVYYRLPYMFIHTLGATFFAYLVLFIAKKSETTGLNRLSYLISAISFLIYFSHPILFLYSLEVRFYTLLSLGVVFTLFLWTRQQLTSPKYFPLQILFCLNSPLHLVVVIPFIAAELLRDKTVINRALVLIVELIILWLLISPRLLIPDAVSQPQVIELMRSALVMFFQNQIIHWTQLVIVVTLIVFSLCFSPLRKNQLLLIGVALFYGLVSMVLAYTKGYFDFYYRHLIHLIPPLLLVVCLIPISIKKISLRIFILLVLVAFLLAPNILFMKNNIIDQKLNSKALIGVRKVFSMAQDKELEVIVTPNSQDLLPQSVYDFYLYTFNWYQKYFPDVAVSYPKTTNEGCEYFFTHPQIIMYALNQPVICRGHTIPQQYLYYSGFATPRL